MQSIYCIPFQVYHIEDDYDGIGAVECRWVGECDCLYDTYDGGDDETWILDRHKYFHISICLSIITIYLSISINLSIYHISINISINVFYKSCYHIILWKILCVGLIISCSWVLFLFVVLPWPTNNYLEC